MIPSAPPSYDESQLRHGHGQGQVPSQAPPPGPPQAPGPAPQVQVVREIRYIEAPSFGHSPQVAMCSDCGVQVKQIFLNAIAFLQMIMSVRPSVRLTLSKYPNIREVVFLVLPI